MLSSSLSVVCLCRHCSLLSLLLSSLPVVAVRCCLLSVAVVIVGIRRHTVVGAQMEPHEAKSNDRLLKIRNKSAFVNVLQINLMYN